MTQALALLRDTYDLASWGDRKLDNAIRRGHATAGAHLNGYEEAATATGLLLIERRRRLPSRGFAPWLAEHFDGARKTAYRYIELGETYLASVSSVTQINPPTAAENEVVDGEVVDESSNQNAPDRANGQARQTDDVGSVRCPTCGHMCRADDIRVWNE